MYFWCMVSDVERFRIADFMLHVTVDRKVYRMQVKQTYLSLQVEQFTITAGDKTLSLQSNRPFLRFKGLKHRGINWKIIHGESTAIRNASAFEKILRELEWYIKDVENKTK